MVLLRVRIGNVLLSGQVGNPNGTGHIIAPDGFTGWDDGTDVRRAEVVRANAHGSYDLPGYLTPRVISLSGTTLARTPEELGWMRSQLVGLLADGGTARVTVDHQSAATWATAGLASKTKFTVNSADQKSASFQIQLWCANPRKFGNRNVAGPTLSSVSAFHYGNFPASPIIVVKGFNASGGYTIQGPDGKRFIVTQGLFSGDEHRIDMATGFLYKNGVLQTGAVSRADIWTVPAGARVVHKIVNASSGATTDMRILTTDTFI